MEEEAGTRSLKDLGGFLAFRGVTIHQQKVIHGQVEAVSISAAGPATRALLLTAMARHRTGHHGRPDPDCARESHLVPGGQAA